MRPLAADRGGKSQPRYAHPLDHRGVEESTLCNGPSRCRGSRRMLLGYNKKEPLAMSYHDGKQFVGSICTATVGDSIEVCEQLEQVRIVDEPVM